MSRTTVNDSSTDRVSPWAKNLIANLDEVLSNPPARFTGVSSATIHRPDGVDHDGVREAFAAITYPSDRVSLWTSGMIVIVAQFGQTLPLGSLV